MNSPRTGSPRRSGRRRLPALAGAAILGLVPGAGCQVEYAGMTLPSGKYMHDDVQYFAPGPAFPWANTQAATQRARMQQMGMTPPPPGGMNTGAPGIADPNAVGNTAPVPPQPGPIPPAAVGGGAPGAIPLGGATAPADPNPRPVNPGAGATPPAVPPPPGSPM